MEGMYGRVLIPLSEGYSEVHFNLEDKFNTFKLSNKRPNVLISTLFDGDGVIVTQSKQPVLFTVPREADTLKGRELTVMTMENRHEGEHGKKDKEMMEGRVKI